MFVSYNQKKQVKFSQVTLDFIEDYKSYEKSLILNKESSGSLRGRFENVVTYLQQYNVSLALVLGVVGLFLINNHLSNGLVLMALYIVYHYVLKMFRKKERLKELELNKLRRSIFYKEYFLKNKDIVLSDLYLSEDDLGLFKHYQKKSLENSLNEADMENIVSLLKSELVKQRKDESEELQNFVRKYQS